MKKDTIIILHWEFSSHRGPQVYNLIRKTDRKINESKYPLICFPELYLLENGYKEFYENYPVSLNLLFLIQQIVSYLYKINNFQKFDSIIAVH